MNNKKGFTLPELMVVVLIMAILISVAVPVYLAARNRAIVRAAQNRLSDAVTAAKNLRSDLDIGYSSQTEAQLEEEAQPINFVIGGAPTADSVEVYVTNSSATTMTLQTMDANDNVRTATIASNGAVNIN